jgi:DNA polymerase-1
MKLRTVILDFAAICHCVKHSTKGLSTDEQETSIIFGFFRRLLEYQKMIYADTIVFAGDSKKSIRKEIYPEYKALRRKEKTEEDKQLDAISYPQFDLLFDKLLPSLGFSNLPKTTKLEADDIIASLCFSKDPKDQYVIVSNDKDLYQLLKEDEVCMYLFSKKEFYTAKNFTNEWGIVPRKWGKQKCFSGCVSDGVKGIERVGDKTAVKFLLGELKETTKTYKAIMSDEGQKIAARNSQLVMLPHCTTPNYEINFSDQLDFDVLVKIFKTYEFRSLLWPNVLKEWRAAFNWK